MNIHQPKIAKAFKFALGKLELKRAVYVFETPSEVINNIINEINKFDDI